MSHLPVGVLQLEQHEVQDHLCQPLNVPVPSRRLRRRESGKGEQGLDRPGLKAGEAKALLLVKPP